jgi:crotonobetainyl-CoA:carnitine CoA-transferase CaiB-like acyl-CoA transferase
LADWKLVLEKQDGQWSIVQTARETLDDEQAWANGYLQMVKYANGAQLPLVPAPVQFDGEAAELTPAPGHGEHTDEVLQQAGVSDERILELKINGAIT